MLDAGFKRVNLWVPQERVALLKELKAQLVDDRDFEALRDFLACSYLAMLEDPDCDDRDRSCARAALVELGVATAASGASEEALASSSDGAR
jgi:hypothetical protein